MKASLILQLLNLEAIPDLTEFNFSEFLCNPEYIKDFEPNLVEFVAFFTHKAFNQDTFKAVVPYAPVFSQWFYENCGENANSAFITSILLSNEKLALENLKSKNEPYYLMPEPILMHWESCAEFYLDDLLSYNEEQLKLNSNDVDTLINIFKRFEKLHPKLLTLFTLIGTAEYYQNKNFSQAISSFTVLIFNKYPQYIQESTHWLKDTKNLSIITAVAGFDINTGMELFKNLDHTMQNLIANRHPEFAVEYIKHNDLHFSGFNQLASRCEEVFLAALEHTEDFNISGELLACYPFHIAKAITQKNISITHSEQSFDALIDLYTNQELIDALISTTDKTKEAQLYLCESSAEWAKVLEKSPVEEINSIYQDFWKGNKTSYSLKSELLSLPF